MERELLLNIKDNSYDRKKISMEIETMKRILPYIESFFAFEVSNDIFDVRAHKLITRSNTLRNIFKRFRSTYKYYVFCRN